MNWLSALFDKLGQFWPFERIEPWERGLMKTYWPRDWTLHRSWPLVRKREAHTTITPLADGVYFVFWYFQEIEKESVTPQVMDLLTQTVTTRDGREVSFSVNIEYEIENVSDNLLKVHAFAASLEAACRIHLARRVRKLTLAELIEKQDWLEERLAETLTTRARKWGTRINEVGFTDLAVSKVFRLMGDKTSL